jgi:hypothetical protein
MNRLAEPVLPRRGSRLIHSFGLSRCSSGPPPGLGVDEGGELDEGVGAAAGAADEALEGGRALGVGEGFEGLVPALDEGRDALAAAGEGLPSASVRGM